MCLVSVKYLNKSELYTLVTGGKMKGKDLNPHGQNNMLH